MTAYAMVGVKITILEGDFEQRRRETCDHFFLDDMDDDVMFCPKCGSKVELQDGRLIQFDDSDDFVTHIETELIKASPVKPACGEWIVVNCYDEFSDSEIVEENGVMFVGLGVYSGNPDEFGMMEMPSMGMVQRAVRELLEPFGLYDNKNFGMWVVDSYS